MKAEILDYDHLLHSGTLITNDGITYVFSGYSWTEQPPPKSGDIVEVIISKSSVVESISYLTADNPYSHNRLDIGAGSLDVPYIRESDYGILDWVLKSLRNFSNFTGRARRKEYWYFYLASTLFMLICRFIVFIVTLPSTDLEAALSIISLIQLLNLALIIPTFAVGARRLHDVGYSGWWQLLVFIPLIGWIALIFLLCKNTSPQHNRWGPPAKPLS